MRKEIAGPVYKRAATVRKTVRTPKYRKEARKPGPVLVYKPE